MSHTTNFQGISNMKPTSKPWYKSKTLIGVVIVAATVFRKSSAGFRAPPNSKAFRRKQTMDRMKLILLTAIISLLSGCVSIRLTDGKAQVCADVPMPEEIEIETDSTK